MGFGLNFTCTTQNMMWTTAIYDFALCKYWYHQAPENGKHVKGDQIQAPNQLVHRPRSWAIAWNQGILSFLKNWPKTSPSKMFFIFYYVVHILVTMYNLWCMSTSIIILDIQTWLQYVYRCNILPSITTNINIINILNSIYQCMCVKYRVNAWKPSNWPTREGEREREMYEDIKGGVCFLV